MSREPMVWTFPTFKAATTEAGLDTAPALECQATSAVLTPQPVFNTVPATGCAGASQSPGTTGWQLDLAWLQDWSKPAAESLSWFSWTNDARLVWVELIPDKTAAEQVSLRGRFWATSGGFGGTFGDGSAAATTATWPALERPEIAPFTPTAATGATAGTPGTFTPAGADTPTDLAALAGVTADPATAWTSGQYVQLDVGTAYWDGTAWASGVAP